MMRRVTALITGLVTALVFAAPVSAGSAPSLSAHCTNPDVAYTVAYPTGWHTNPRVEGEGAAEDVAPCRAFSPEQFTITPGSEPSGIAILIGTSTRAFEPTGEQVTVDGHPAYRYEEESTTPGFEGFYYTYVVNLGGATVLTAQTSDQWVGNYAENKAILDEQMAGIELHPFSDVAESIFVWDIAWLYDAGITVGCAPDRFCPRSFVTRQEMASFLARALELPAASQDYFTDDGGSQHEDDINRLAEAGITVGCAPDRFCPLDRVQRDQMASFLARALELPAASTDFFGDDEDNMHEANINRVAQAGIARGCTEDRYCPDDFVTRGQMAAFLHRALI